MKCIRTSGTSNIRSSKRQFVNRSVLRMITRKQIRPLLSRRSSNRRIIPFHIPNSNRAIAPTRKQDARTFTEGKRINGRARGMRLEKLERFCGVKIVDMDG